MSKRVTKYKRIIVVTTSRLSSSVMTVLPVEEVLRIEDLAVSLNENHDQSQQQNELEKELEGVRNLNKVMEGVIAAMSKAKDNMEVRLAQ